MPPIDPQRAGPRSAWQASEPSSLAPLAAGEVHVWRARPGELPHGLRGLLSEEEERRAARVAGTDRGEAWARGRGLLRTLLGGYLGAAPAGLAIEARPGGRPAVGDGELCFSVSHAGGLLLLAFAAGAPVGVDVEVPRPRLRELGLARRAFGPQHAARLERLPPGRRTQELLRAWVAYEATLKAHGRGLWSGPAPAAPAGWPARLPVGGGAAGAVVALAPRGPLRLMQPALADTLGTR